VTPPTSLVKRDWQACDVRRSQSLDRPLLALVALVLASTAARFALYRGVDAPWIAPDEQLYGLLGRSLLAGDGLTVLGESVPFYSLLYPLLVGLAFVGNDLAGGVTLVQALQAFLMSATAVPVFLWARPAVGWRWALVAGGLTVLIPGLAYGALFMSEALYYLVATVAVWALASCLHNPTLTRQALLLGAIGVALLTRLQAVGFAGAIVAAILVLAVSERSTAPVRRMRLTLAALGAVALVWTVSRVVLGGVGELLGAYAPLAEARSYSLADVAQSVAWQTGAVTIVTVGIPLVALAILAWGVLRGREADPYVRALVAAAASYIVVTIVEVGAFASRFVEHVTERQLLSVIPPAFVALVVWLHRGAPRPQPVASLAALLVAASALLLPLERVTTLAAYADAPSLIPLERLSRHLSQASFEAVYAAAVASVLLLAVFVPRRAAPALAGLVAVGLAVGSLVASREIRNGSHTERERTFAGAPRGWIDASGARDVTLLLTGERFWPSTWELIFWNESVGRIARFPGVLSPGAVPQDVVVPHVDGSLSTVEGADLDTAHVATSTDVMLVGERLASTPASFEQPGMALWRVTPPARLAQRIVGLRPNGDLHTGEAANIRVYACGPGRLELTLLGKEGKPTRVLVGGQVAAERAIPPRKVWRPSVPAPAIANGKKICVFTLETDGLVGSTRIEWVPSVGAG
jgi:hypothetical protein